MHYNAQLGEISELRLPEAQPDRDHVFHLYVVRTGQRDQLQAFLTSRQIDTLVHYPVPMHLQKAYADLGYESGDFPETEQAANEILSLPMYPELHSSQQGYVIEAVTEFFKN
jgi:dTDP-4-amino-4,6-dideoxygalactose transaminase